MTRSKQRWIAIACTITCLMAAGCQQDDPQAPVKQLRAFLAQSKPPTAGVEYRVYPPDHIAFRSVRVEEINGVIQQVRPDGKVNLPLVGEFDVAGKTPKEIEQELIAAESKFYEDVDVNVQVVGYNSQKVFIWGQVNAPGPQPWTGNDTLIDVLARAQPTNIAWIERIKLVRSKPPVRGGYMHDPTTKPSDAEVLALAEEGKNEVGSNVMIIDLSAMMKSGDLSQNVYLYPDDQVYVQPSIPGAIGLFLQAILFPVSPVVQAVSAPGNVSGAARSGLVP